MAQIKVKLGDQELTLSPPASPTVQQEIINLTLASQPRAVGAALGVCWGANKNRPEVNLQLCGYDVGRFGGRVFDELVGREGVTRGEVMRAGQAAIDLIVSDYVGREEVEAELGNSEGEEPETE